MHRCLEVFMTPTEPQPPRPAVISLLLFSQPPRETPSIGKAIAAVTGAHAIVLAALLWMITLTQRSDLPSGVLELPDGLDIEFTSLPIGLGSPPDSKAPGASARPKNQPRGQRKKLLGAPLVRAPEPPTLIPPTVTAPTLGSTAIDAFKTPLAPREVTAVAPRGVHPTRPLAPTPGGNDAGASNGNSGNDVESLTLDELAREPRFTPFTQAPELMNRVEIRGFLQTRYPAYMSSRGMGGRAVLWILIDAGGGIRKGVLLRSSGSSVLDDAALEAIDRMEFRPAVNHGKRVPVWVQLPISFQAEW